MVELQVIWKLLNEKDMKPLIKNGIDSDYFKAYLPEYEFITEHFEKYGNIPDRETIINAFDDFEFQTVGESWDYLLDKLKEERTYREMCKVVDKLQDMTDDSNEAVKYLSSEVDRISRMHKAADIGLDIIRNASERLEEFGKKNEGLTGEIPVGLTDLQEAIGGWTSEADLVLIVGRTNEGKTWLLLFFLTVAWKAGKRVLFYSGEMPKNVIASRFDTLNAHFSNRALRKGDESIKEDYTKYISDLENCDNESFIVVTPKDLNGRLDQKKLQWLIDIVKPDIIGLDQLSIMEDARRGRGDSDPIRLKNISEDLYAMSERTGIPILSPAQAKRKEKKKAGDDDEDTDAPETEDIYGGDGPAQNATRIIGMKQIEAGLKISVRKNRYGERGQEFIYPWNIDTGEIKDTSVLVKNRVRAMEEEARNHSRYEESSNDATDVF